MSRAWFDFGKMARNQYILWWGFQNPLTTACRSCVQTLVDKHLHRQNPMDNLWTGQTHCQTTSNAIAQDIVCPDRWGRHWTSPPKPEKHSFPAAIYKKDGNQWLPSFQCARCVIFPGRRQPSIVTVNELNYCVRNGNRCTLVTINTHYSGFTPWKLNRNYSQLREWGLPLIEVKPSAY